MACADWKERADDVRWAIEELKKDIVTLQANIQTAESLLDSIKREEDARKFNGFDIEKGLKHIEIID